VTFAVTEVDEAAPTATARADDFGGPKVRCE